MAFRFLPTVRDDRQGRLTPPHPSRRVSRGLFRICSAPFAQDTDP